MNKQQKIFTVLSNGTKIAYNVVLTFKSGINNNYYVIYTDNTYDQNKKIRFYVGAYNPNNQNPFLGEPQSKEEWLEINSILNQVIPVK